MPCPVCDSPTVVFSVPEEYREYAPKEAATAVICTHCLSVEAADGAVDPDADSSPEFDRVSQFFPRREAQAVPLALTLGLCSSLATNRQAIEATLEAVERHGGDPLLVIDRLLDDPSLEPQIDLERRRHQLEDLLY